MRRRILLIQTDPAEAAAVLAALTVEGETFFDVDWVRTSADGLARLRRSIGGTDPSGAGISAVLADLSLEDSEGLETFETLFATAPHIPLLVLCGSDEEEIAKLAVQRGAQDYLLKNRLDNYLLPKALGSMIDRAAIAEALFIEKERAQVTLNSIGDAVISTDANGDLTFLNSVAETLTGWSLDEAAGRPLPEVFRLIDMATNQAARNPMEAAIRENKTVVLGPNCVLVGRDGMESAIEDSAAPIHDRRGNVTGAVMVFHDVSATRALSLQMAYLAQHDALTDLPNRLLLNDRLAHSLAYAKRHNRQLAVLYLDLDMFKRVNDSLGHSVGDGLLQSVASQLRQAVRAADTVSRLGGDEFVVLLSEISHPQDAATCAEKILARLRAPHVVGTNELHVTVSIGIAVYPEDGTDCETLLKHADLAMYRAKSEGRNNFQFFLKALNDEAVERVVIETGLRKALGSNELVLHYQPTVALGSGAVVGVEALVRWQHPRRGLIPPRQFIPIAEECGLILPLGNWVIREACRQGQEWQNNGFPPVRISVNVSAVELGSEGFVSRVRGALESSRFPPDLLELELTETFLLVAARSTEIVLTALKKLGVHLALDDFGTGFSSFSHLRHYPIDTLKIDQSFVAGIAEASTACGIVKAMIAMGANLGIRVVAEGVETARQLALLKQYRCPEAQGFYFGHPVPPTDVSWEIKHKKLALAG